MPTAEERKLSAEIRQKIVEALRVDLVGPSSEDEVLDENPMFEYLTGMLYPQCLADKCQTGEQEIDTDSDIVGDSDYTSMPDEDDNEPMTATKFKQQSSIGMSFYIKKSTKSLTIHVTWGDYTKSTEKYVDKNGEEKTASTYPRIARDSVADIDMQAFDKYSEFALVEDSNLILRVTKIGLGNEYNLVTIYLINRRPKGETELEPIIFQAKLEVESSEGAVFIAENICRDVLTADEFYYEQRPIFGRGRGCAVEWVAVDNKTASKMTTAFIPEHEIPGVGASIEGFAEDHFLMSFMAKPANKTETLNRLDALSSEYKKWIATKLVSNPKMSNSSFKSKIGDGVINKCKEVLARIDDGINVLKTDEVAYDAFCFMNEAMSLQRSILGYAKKHGKGISCAFQDFLNPRDINNHFCWRPFQIAFILMNLRGIVDPTHKDRDVVDLLYFPTGGGKTEAYLGLMAFVIANRRLRAKPDDALNKDGGVTIILRYTLRLLTTQQRDRLTKMIIAAEMIRRRYNPKYGNETISLGFWVGGGVTPNKFADLKENKDDPEKESKNKNLLYKQLLTCPFCGAKLEEKNYFIDIDTCSVRIYCPDEHCIFHRYKGQMTMPVYFVDEEIYRRCPTVILATVDKFANLPWEVKTNALFGRVDRKCSRDGYISIGEDHPIHRETDELAKSQMTTIHPFAPPELIVQDELHLITGPLGTIYGAYETIIQDFCTYYIGDKKILPKYVVSTATIKNADEQIKCLYGRKAMLQFPANGFEIGDSFFIKEIPLDESPFRQYVGISANGQSMKTTTLRVYAIILQIAQELANDSKYGSAIDPYYTLVGYFNSIRELGGTVRLLQDDIPKRIYRIKNKYGFSKDRKVFRRVEITSRVSSYKIGELLKQLETPYGNRECLDTAIATNMIAVGMDVDRLGLMTVMGQPKQNSEYIQATSRIGRQFPGVVFTIYNPYRPRDLSHYENFVGYHTQLYRYVEGTTATPFSARARDRVLHALIIAAIRLKYPEFANNKDANDINNLSTAELNEVTEMILSRLSIVNPVARADTKNEIETFIDQWKTIAAQQKGLRYYVQKTDTYNRLMNYYGEPCGKNEKGTLNSMREVEASASMYYYTEE